MIYGQDLFDQPVKNNLRISDSIWKITTGHRNGYTTGCLLDYNDFINYCKMIAIYLRKQQVLNANPKGI